MSLQSMKEWGRKLSVFFCPLVIALFSTAALAAPELKTDSGDTAWMLTSVALVLFMTIPGLALFYAGLVRKKNVIATAMQSFATTALVAVLWVICGYSIAFTNGTGELASVFGDCTRFFLAGFGAGGAGAGVGVGCGTTGGVALPNASWI